MPSPTLIKKVLSTLLLFFFVSSPSQGEGPHYQVAITQFVEHVAVDVVRESLIKELAVRGYEEGKNLTITFENAQANAATAGQISRNFVGIKPNVIVAITTPSSQSMVKAVGTNPIPIVFSAVTDPVGAGLVSSLKNQKANITGVMDAPPIKEQIKFIKTLLPDTKTIGVIYNPGDNGSVSSLSTIRKTAEEEGLLIIEATPVRSADIRPALLSLVGRVDAIYVPLDNMVVSAMAALTVGAMQHQIPVFSADSGSVESGALACYGYSYAQTGFKTGDIVAEILQGKPAYEIPVASPDTLAIFINKKTLEALKISVPESIRTQAHFY